MTEHIDSIVIGAGVIGLAVARALAQAKSVINAAAIDTESALMGEQIAFDACLPDPERRRRMGRFLELGCQTREGEPTLGEDLERLGS